MKILKRILIIFVIIALALTAGACLTVTVTDDGFLPSFMGVGAYETLTGEYAPQLPYGSLALVDKGAEVTRGDLAAYSHNGRVKIGVVTANDGVVVSVMDGDEQVELTPQLVKGRVFYQIEYLGSAAGFLRANKEAVWAVAAILIAAAVIWRATRPGRMRRREVKELIKLLSLIHI